MEAFVFKCIHLPVDFIHFLEADMSIVLRVLSVVFFIVPGLLLLALFLTWCDTGWNYTPVIPNSTQ